MKRSASKIKLRRTGRRLFDTEGERQLLSLHEQGYAAEYIAVTMDCSVATVFNYLRRAKTK